jgi:hypothetical protein
LWTKAKKVFKRAGKARHDFKHFAVHGIENLTDKKKVRWTLAASSHSRVFVANVSVEVGGRRKS